ncbi:Ig-like domain-containing protein [Vibrio jasicida]|uniref:Ig-like domain-containing protein n=1 Tax=Vibrio jasicida TaxID=766224 RepID=UPI00163DE922|nr:Ig-like domain-containing protein [Vibrio jasicida]
MVIRICLIFLFSLFLIGCNNGDEGLLYSDKVCHNEAHLVIIPDDIKLPVGIKKELNLELQVLDETCSFITVDSIDNVKWNVSDTSIVDIDSKGNVRGLSVGNAIVSASVEYENSLYSASAMIQVTTAIPLSLQLTPKVSVVSEGQERDMTAQVVFSDNTTWDITRDDKLVWNVKDLNVVNILKSKDNRFEALQGKKEGYSDIEVSTTINGVYVKDLASITVTPANIVSLEVQPKEVSLPIGEKYEFKALATLSNGEIIDITDSRDITWISDDESIVKNNKGTSIFTSKIVGETSIVAKFNYDGNVFLGRSSFVVTHATPVSVEINPSETSVLIGNEKKYSAFATFSDGQKLDVTNSVYWVLNNDQIASISNTDNNRGLVHGKSVGQSKVIARYIFNEGVIEDIATLKVNEAELVSLDISPNEINIKEGGEFRLIAKATFSDNTVLDVTKDERIHWSSDDESTAIVYNTEVDKGVLLANNSGSTSIKAKYTYNNMTMSDSSTVLVTPANIFFYIKQTHALPIYHIDEEEICAASEAMGVEVNDNGDIEEFKIDSDCRLIEYPEPANYFPGIFEFTVEHTYRGLSKQFDIILERQII